MKRIDVAIEEILKLWRLNRIGIVRPADYKHICDAFEELQEAQREQEGKAKD